MITRIVNGTGIQSSYLLQGTEDELHLQQANEQVIYTALIYIYMCVSGLCKAFLTSQACSFLWRKNVWTTERVAEELFLVFSIIIVSPLSQVADRVRVRKKIYI